MYPDLKDFRKEVNSEGPWIIRGSYSWFLIYSIMLIFVRYLSELDDDAL